MRLCTATVSTSTADIASSGTTRRGERRITIITIANAAIATAIVARQAGQTTAAVVEQCPRTEAVHLALLWFPLNILESIYCNGKAKEVK